MVVIEYNNLYKIDILFKLRVTTQIKYFDGAKAVIVEDCARQEEY